MGIFQAALSNQYSRHWLLPGYRAGWAAATCLVGSRALSKGLQESRFTGCTGRSAATWMSASSSPEQT